MSSIGLSEVHSYELKEKKVMIGKVSKDYGSGKIAKSSITLGKKYTPDILSSIAEKGLNNYNKSRNK